MQTLRRFSARTLVRHWRTGLALLALPVVLLLVGPFALLLAWLLWHWAAASRWDAEQRWAGIKGFAVSGLLADLALILLHTPLASSWIALHLPGTPTLANLWVRWALAVSLSPALALARERSRPATLTLSARLLRLPEQPAPGERAPKAGRRSANGRRSARRREKPVGATASGALPIQADGPQPVPSRDSRDGARDLRPTREAEAASRRDPAALRSAAEADQRGESLQDLL